MAKFQVWREGFGLSVDEGGRQPAEMFGEAEGATFVEACQNFFESHPEFNWPPGYEKEFFPEGLFRLEGGRPIWWGCNLFDNEADARKQFG